MPNTEAKPNLVHVAVGAIVQRNASSEQSAQGDSVLIAKRANHQHQGGLWEFPGGKVEAGEHVTDALVRELQEELAITATAFQPLIQIRHDYGDKCVLLDVWVVTEFSGVPVGQEGQPLEWVPLNRLHYYAFPAANRPIVQALSLPTLIAITPDLDDADALFEFCLKAVDRGANGIQLRAPQLTTHDVRLLYQRIEQLSGVQKLWLNSRHLVNAAGNLEKVDLDVVASLKGVHFCASHLVAAQTLMAAGVFAHCSTTAACHNAAEIIWAETADVDAILLSPVLPTASHPEASGLGWSEFARLVQAAKRPVYALGGMGLKDIAMAKQSYAQGVAGISLFL